VGLRPFACWNCEFESSRGHACVSLVSVVCYQVEDSVSGWSLVQRSPTDCGVSECDREALIMRRLWPTGDCRAMEKTKFCQGNVLLHTAVKGVPSPCMTLASRCWIYVTNFCDGVWPSWEVLLVNTGNSTTQSLFPEPPSHSLFQKFPVCYWIRNFVIVFPKTVRYVRFWARWNRFTFLHIFKSFIIYYLPLWFSLCYEHTQIRGSIEYFVTFFCARPCLSPAQNPRWNITLCQLSDVDYWTYTFRFHPPSQDLSLVLQPPEAPFPCNQPPYEPIIINYASLFISSQNSSILGRHVSKNKDFLIVRVAANEVISLYMLFFCFLLNCAVQKWERTAECILLTYDIWKVHLVNTALQAGRSRVWFPIMSLEFFIEIILPAALWPWVRLSL